MSKKEKLIARLLSKPKDFTFAELTALLNCFGYQQVVTGKTGGSRVAFANGGNDYIRLHKPHPRNILKPYQVEDVITALKERNLL
ncbi:type II toxin-antitoxin system HicA family toxin [Acetanaerobacterium elongatum]|uniref:HicA toxin of toxin-antitoxin n=1 Tax=Acetanaerobacterium elongatum TaxID=258515 RepID=A0A1H0EZ90_9FIRM|nr:type II toxin-antitoxin system HicA family toxin [Acetanaerobacterium elongatum]SDN87619.1 HicA toxin of toxin-antitoxin [Acetanaerobacterium elongatum]